MTSTSSQTNPGQPSPQEGAGSSTIPSVDPRKESCPNFGLDLADTVQELSDLRGQTEDEVIKSLEEHWKEKHDARCAAWMAARDFSQETPTLASQVPVATIEFNDQRVVDTRPSFRPCTYAKTEVDAVRYCALWYFTSEGGKKISAAVPDGSANSLSFADDDGVLTLRPTASVRASKNVIPDSKLSWDQFDVASRRFVEYVASSKAWGRRGTEAMYDLFNNLKDHPVREQEGGRTAIQRYAEDVRVLFHDELKSGGPGGVFNPGLINDDRLNTYLQRVLHDQGVAVNKEFERRLAELNTVRLSLWITAKAVLTNFHIVFFYLFNMIPFIRFFSLAVFAVLLCCCCAVPLYRVGPLCRLLLDPLRVWVLIGQLVWQGVREFRFFGAGTDIGRYVCAICLGRHENSRECRLERLHSGAAAFAARNERGHLVRRSDSQLLCFNFQTTKGCVSTTHADRHMCSGCGSGYHGAHRCPLAASL